jgi:hypothetical protein
MARISSTEIAGTTGRMMPRLGQSSMSTRHFCEISTRRISVSTAARAAAISAPTSPSSSLPSRRRCAFASARSTGSTAGPSRRMRFMV